MGGAPEGAIQAKSSDRRKASAEESEPNVLVCVYLVDRCIWEYTWYSCVNLRTLVF